MASESTEAPREHTGSPTAAIVGIGASAGGLEAFRRLLEALPSRTGMSYVFVQHLAPGHESRLPEILCSYTDMPVVQAADGLALEPDHVYVIPPNASLTLEGGGTLKLAPREGGGARHMPVDRFFRSLAEQAGNAAIGVILSGTASDGTEGSRHIRAVGGITIAQDPDTTQYPGMPHSAINAAVVDLVLTPEKIAAELARLAQHPYLRRVPEPMNVDEAERPEPQLAPEIDVAQSMRRLIRLLRQGTGVDFSNYKPGTMHRRIQRRMTLNHCDDLGSYLVQLEKQPAELRRLYDDLLIHVTRFFRDAESFEAIKEVVLPKLVKDRQIDDPIRVWVAGCATGEEAYSMAIVLLEYLGAHAPGTPVQIFATDVYEDGIAQARNGLYGESISADVSEARLHRFFTPANGGYQISKAVRDLCVFSRHDLAQDPPFSRIDLLLCRNVLIYMNQALQEHLLVGFHYALKPSGYLMLGEAESPRHDNKLFTPVDKMHRIYARSPARMRIHRYHPTMNGEVYRPGERATNAREPRSMQIRRAADSFIINQFGPPAVVVDEACQVHYIRGSTGAYLQPAPGEPTHNLMKMAREGLVPGLKSVLEEAQSSGKRARREGLWVKSDGGLQAVTVEAVPLVTAGARGHFLVLFEEPPTREAASHPAGETTDATGPTEPANDEDREARIHTLEDELTASRTYLQSVIQDLEGTNEALQTANEEILWANEELQSANEELDTAREELQSTNEELNTLNDELHDRNQELARANSDLVNLLASVQVAIVMVDQDLKLRRYTPAAEELMNLIPGDVDRPIRHINSNFVCADLEQLMRRAADEMVTSDREVPGRQSLEGRWYALRVRPYKSVDQKIEGSVLSLFEITDVKHRERELERMRRYAELVVETAHEPLMVLTGDLRVKDVNRSFCQMFDVTPERTVGQLLYDLGNGQWDIPALREALARIASSDDGFENFTVSHTFPRIGAKTMRLNGRKLEGDDELHDRILLAFEDAGARHDA